jgi:hypothetical protein
MELSGKIIAVLPLAEGTGKNGNQWYKQEYVLETPGQYPKKVCFSLWNSKIDEANIEEEDEVTVSIEVESREYNGRWYTEVKGWKVQKHNQYAAKAAPVSAPPASDPVPPMFTPTSNDDDLPF